MRSRLRVGAPCYDLKDGRSRVPAHFDFGCHTMLCSDIYAMTCRSARFSFTIRTPVAPHCCLESVYTMVRSFGSGRRLSVGPVEEISYPSAPKNPTSPLRERGRPRCVIHTRLAPGSHPPDSCLHLPRDAHPMNGPRVRAACATAANCSAREFQKPPHVRRPCETRLQINGAGRCRGNGCGVSPANVRVVDAVVVAGLVAARCDARARRASCDV